VGEGLINEYEAASAFIILHQSNQKDEGLDDLLSARGFAIIQPDASFAIKVERDFQLGLAQDGIVTF